MAHRGCHINIERDVLDFVREEQFMKIKNMNNPYGKYWWETGTFSVEKQLFSLWIFDTVNFPNFVYFSRVTKGDLKSLVSNFVPTKRT